MENKIYPRSPFPPSSVKPTLSLRLAPGKPPRIRYFKEYFQDIVSTVERSEKGRNIKINLGPTKEVVEV